MATRTPISEAPTIEVERLRACVRGPVILPADPGYDAARAIWNGAIDRRPACIARCTGVADVVAAVRLARARSCWWQWAPAATASEVTQSATADS